MMKGETVNVTPARVTVVLKMSYKKSSELMVVLNSFYLLTKLIVAKISETCNSQLRGLQFSKVWWLFSDNSASIVWFSLLPSSIFCGVTACIFLLHIVSVLCVHVCKARGCMKGMSESVLIVGGWKMTLWAKSEWGSRKWEGGLVLFGKFRLGKRDKGMEMIWYRDKGIKW